MFSKNIDNLQKLSVLPYFTIDKVADVFEIGRKSAAVLCSRYAKRKLFVRLKNSFYTTAWKLENPSSEELFKIANIAQVPSYVSLMTAMSFFNLTTQVQRNYIESISLKRTKEIEISSSVLKYIKLKENYYFDFIKSNGYFIATKEKSFLDAVYLFSFGKYKFDFNSIDVSKLDNKKLMKLLKSYPVKTKKIVRKICSI